MVLTGHLLLILIIQLAMITKLNKGKFYSNCPSNKNHGIESGHALDKSVFEKRDHHSASFLFLCVSKKIRVQHRDQPVMNYFSDGITKGPQWDELLDVCDMYFRLSVYLQDL